MEDVFTTPEERAHDEDWTEDYLNVEKYLESLKSRASAQEVEAREREATTLADFWHARAIRIDAAVQELNFPGS